MVRIVGGALGGWVLLASVLSKLATGFGVVAILASLAIVMSTVSLVVSGNNAKQLRKMNQPADAAESAADGTPGG